MTRRSWQVAPSGFDKRKAHIYTQIEHVRGITYYRSACGKKVFTMDDKQLTPPDGHECCGTCERNVWRAHRKGRAGCG